MDVVNRPPAPGAAVLAAVVALLAAVTAAVGVTTPARSGPMCRLDACLQHPYTAVAAFVPRDYLWMYPALLLVVAVLALVAVIATTASPHGRAAAAFALVSAGVGATALAADYGLQLAVVQPSLLAGETDGLSLLSQYNPHGVFIGLEDVGYAALAASFGAMGLAMSRGGRAARACRWCLVGGGAATWAALILLAVIYGRALEYRFELAAMSVHWLVLMTTGTLLAVSWRGRSRAATVAP